MLEVNSTTIPVSNSINIVRVLEKFREYYVSIVTKNFYNKGKEFSAGGWPQLSSRYYKRKKSLMAKGVIKYLDTLRASGSLFKYVTKYTNYVIQNNSLVISVPYVYAAVHQYGSSSINVPARPYVAHYSGGMRNKDIIFLDKLIQNVLNESKEKRE